MGLLSEIVLLLIIHLLTSLISFLSTNHFELFADILTFLLFLVVNIFFLKLLLFVNYSVFRNLLHLLDLFRLFLFIVMVWAEAEATALVHLNLLIFELFLTFI